MDSFSFGMVCLWILFGEDFGYDDDESNLRIIAIKRRGELCAFAQKRLEAQQDLDDDDTRCASQEFFNSTLCSDQNTRGLRYARIFDAESEGNDRVHHHEEEDLILQDVDFMVRTLIR